MDVTFCLMTCGEETELDCLGAIHFEKELGAFRYQEVRNLSPASVALNAMFDQCETRFLVPLDADMVLYLGYWDRIRDKIQQHQDKNDWHSILFPLWDVFTQRKILALKVFNMGAMKEIKYPDDACPDILHYRMLEQAGLKCWNYFDEDPIGDHIIRGKYFCYAKYRDLYMVHRVHPQYALDSHFQGGRNIKEKSRNHADFFRQRLELTGNEDYLYAFAGMVEGLTAPIKCTSKDLSDREMRVSIDEVEEIYQDWYSKNKSDRIFI